MEVEDKINNKSKFEPFEFTVKVETEQELCELMHRLNVGNVDLRKQIENLGLRLKYTCNVGTVKELKDYLHIKCDFFNLSRYD